MGKTKHPIVYSLINTLCFVHRYDRLEIPLHIVPKDTVSRPCLDAMVELPKILSEEEEEAYSKAQQRVGEEDLLTIVHNGAG